MSKVMDYAFSANSLHDSYMKIKSSVNFKYSVQNYGINELEEINKFRESYNNGTFKFTKGSEFNIYERGKKRRIKTTVFRDRVPIHSYCENVLLKELRRYLIYDNCASLKGKGVDMQRDRLRTHLQKYYKKYGTNKGYILKCDFRKFFDNLDHDKLIKSVGEKLNDAEAMDFFKMVLQQFEIDVPKDDYELYYNNCFSYIDYCNIEKENNVDYIKMKKSVGIGNEMSQFCGVYYPTKLDNLIKIVMGFKFYGRYMDDFYIIDYDKEKLILALKEIKSLCKEMGLYLNDKKTYIQKLNKLFTFLKVKYILSDTGKVKMILSKQIFTRERVKLKKFKNMLDEGKLGFSAIQSQYRSWRGNIVRKRKIGDKKCKKPIYDNYKQLKRMDELYNDLFIKPFISGSYMENIKRSNKC